MLTFDCTEEKILAFTEPHFSDKDWAKLDCQWLVLSRKGSTWLTGRRAGFRLFLAECRIAGGEENTRLLFNMGVFAHPAIIKGVKNLYSHNVTFFQKGDLNGWAVIELPESKRPIRNQKRFVEAEARKIAHEVAKICLKY